MPLDQSQPFAAHCLSNWHCIKGRWFCIVIVLMFSAVHLRLHARDPFPYQVNVRLSQNCKTDKALVLHCRTREIFPCSNYRIAATVQQFDDTMIIRFTHIVQPKWCLRALGPARADLALSDLTSSTYVLQFHREESVTQGILTITDDFYHLNMPESSSILVVNPRLQKCP